MHIKNHVSRTQPIRPSKIGLFYNCPLRYVFETERHEFSGLPPGPQVYLGIAFHGAIEKFWGEPSIRGIDIREWIRAEFGKLILAEENGLCRWLYLRDGIDGLIIPSLVSDVSRLAQQQVSASGYGKFKGSSINNKKPQSIFGVERLLISEVLDLAGRADLIEKRDDGVSVVDFKLGLKLNESGEPRTEYLLQLAAYALIVKEQLGNLDLSLELRSPKRSTRHPFDAVLEANVLQTIKKMHLTLPRLKAIDQSEIAQKGDHCLSCGYRSNCSNYLTRLSTSQAVGDDFVSPLDVHGKVISISQEDGMKSVLLSAKPDQRRVLISGIPNSVIGDHLKQGDDLLALSLRTPEVRSKGNYIANFHLFDCTNPRQSAFSCKILRNSSLS